MQVRLILLVVSLLFFLLSGLGITIIHEPLAWGLAALVGSMLVVEKAQPIST